MIEADTTVALVALLLSMVSLGFAAWTAYREQKENRIKNLLGEKESVAYAALRLIREGLPRDKKERATTIYAVIQACIFEGSDRARALLFQVIDQNLDKHVIEIRHSYISFKKMYTDMERYDFGKEELDLGKARQRLNALEKITHARVNEEKFET